MPLNGLGYYATDEPRLRWPELLYNCTPNALVSSYLCRSGQKMAAVTDRNCFDRLILSSALYCCEVRY